MTRTLLTAVIVMTFGMSTYAAGKKAAASPAPAVHPVTTPSAAQPGAGEITESPRESYNGLTLSNGLYAGLNATMYSYKGVNDSDVTAKAGGELGYSLVVPFSDSFGLRTGAGFVGKSAAVGTGILNNGEVTQKNIYLEIPVTAILAFGTSGLVSGIGGFNVDYFITAECDAEFGACPYTDSELKKTMKKVVVSAVVGARFRLGHVGSHHNLETLIESGLTDVDKNDTKMPFSTSVRYVYNF